MPRRLEPDPLALKIGQRIRKLRKEAGLSLEKLAYESELGSKGHLSDVERGLTRPTVATLKVLADRLGVALLDLVTFPDEDQRQKDIDRQRQERTPSLGYNVGPGSQRPALGLVLGEPKDDSILRQLGPRIRRKRLDAGLDRAAVTSRARLKADELRKIEEGKRDPTVGTVERIAAAIGVDFLALVGGK